MTSLSLHLATAESCTGGLIGHRLTNVPGSSSYYQGGVVSYANNAKVWLLGVHQQTLDQFGAVSRETVIEMANGARSALEADIGLSVSGIAGPDGGTAEKPVGLVWVGLSYSGVDLAHSFQLAGDRGQIKEQAAEMALSVLWECLEALSPA
jgi:PncC family amidohydrolase